MDTYPIPEGFDAEVPIVEEMRGVMRTVRELNQYDTTGVSKYLQSSGLALEQGDDYEIMDARRISITKSLGFFHSGYKRLMLMRSMTPLGLERIYGEREIDPDDFAQGARMIGHACLVSYALGQRVGFEKSMRYGVRGALQISGIAIQRVDAARSTSAEEFLESQLRSVRASNHALESVALRIRAASHQRE